ncbi:MAG TPA: peptidylprolyl isomerase [Myxococcales bacterium LLY-WYZ-16_1]|jgi:peptidyl-prolyl cis-trans isomerase A (cyclophilin A)|nr:peptidylprolyl isomerase [Myxococcales bacterium LLY-WYZ-16_1]
MDALLHAPEVVEPAPETFAVELTTSQGPLVADVVRAWAPRGADRFHHLVCIGFYDGCRFFRVVPGFVAQVGLHPDPAVSKVWRKKTFRDDPVVQSNQEGTVCFATSGRDARTTQFFVNLRNNARLDAMGFAAFGRLRDLEPARRLHDGYGESVQQGRLAREGEAYLASEFPNLDVIHSARVL